jgi:hypothetical protein
MLLMGKVIASQQILMEKIIPGMLFESKAVITDFGWVVEMRILRSVTFFEKKNKLGA